MHSQHTASYIIDSIMVYYHCYVRCYYLSEEILEHRRTRDSGNSGKSKLLNVVEGNSKSG